MKRHTLTLPLFALTLLLSATLLFWIQPLVSKMILPYLGGSPSVWNTCMMFFQGMLLLGYLYAHLNARLLPPILQPVVQLTILGLGLLLLPIHVAPDWEPSVVHPIPELLTQLLKITTLPLLAICASAPLLQQWFTHTEHPDAQDPYFLYSASNMGSLLALVLFIVAFEPYLTLTTQSRWWATGFIALLVLTALCGLSNIKPAKHSITTESNNLPNTITVIDRAYWTALAFAPSSLLLGVTTYITTDIASTPLFWVIPLLLYLCTFIIAFARRSWIRQSTTESLQLTFLFTVFVMMLPMTGQIFYLLKLFFNLALFFFTALACHQELVQRRPHHNHLTEFYIWLSIGGFLGGVFNALIAPLLFTYVFEYPIMLAFALLIRPPHLLENKLLRLSLASLFIFTVYFNTPFHDKTIFTVRNFFGTTRVVNYDNTFHLLMDGTTLHGAQFTNPDKANAIIGYYHELPSILKDIRATRKPLSIAIAGLGSGTCSCLARDNDTITFYEINQDMIKIANNPAYFSYLQQCQPKGGIILGDARLAMRHANDHSYDVMILDAFSSDAIPMHLLTQQAFQVYLAKLKPNGVILINISNRYLDLLEPISALADSLNLHGKFISTQENLAAFQLKSLWVALSPVALDTQLSSPLWRDLPPSNRDDVWTDDYSNIIRHLRLPDKIRLW